MHLSGRVYLVGSGSSGFSLSHDSDCHVYLIDGGAELALIDAGAGLGLAQILDRIEALGLDKDKISRLFLTHLHADHAGGAAGLKEALPRLKVAVAKEVAQVLEAGDEKAIHLDLGKKGGYYAQDYRFRPCPVDLELVEGQEITVGEIKLRVVETPGHSAGHLCFLMEDQGLLHLFSGDNLFFGGRILLQPVADCSLADHLASLLKLRGLGIEVFLPGHGSFSLRHGQRHVDLALEWLDKCLIPPSFI